jgi:hypothetical protein
MEVTWMTMVMTISSWMVMHSARRTVELMLMAMLTRSLPRRWWKATMTEMPTP